MGDISHVSVDNCYKHNLKYKYYAIELIIDSDCIYPHLCVPNSFLEFYKDNSDGLLAFIKNEYTDNVRETRGCQVKGVRSRKIFMANVLFGSDNIMDATKFILNKILSKPTKCRYKPPSQDAPISYSKSTSLPNIETNTSQGDLTTTSSHVQETISETESQYYIQSTNHLTMALKKQCEIVGKINPDYKHKKFSIKQCHQTSVTNMKNSFNDVLLMMQIMFQNISDCMKNLHESNQGNIVRSNSELINNSGSAISQSFFAKNFNLTIEELCSDGEKIQNILNKLRRDYKPITEVTDTLSNLSIYEINAEHEMSDELNLNITNLNKAKQKRYKIEQNNINKSIGKSKKKKRKTNHKVPLQQDLDLENKMPKKTTKDNESNFHKGVPIENMDTRNKEVDKDNCEPQENCDKVLTLSQFIEKEQEIADKEKKQYNNILVDARDEDEIIHEEDRNNDRLPKRIRSEAREFTLPEDYNPKDSRWTLKYRKKEKGLVELSPHSGVYVDSIKLSHCKRVSRDSKTFARMLLTEVFSDVALRTCSLTGKRANAFDPKGTSVRPGLDERARTVLLNYVEQHGITQKWVPMETERVLSSIRSKLQEMRYKNGRKRLALSI